MLKSNNISFKVTVSSTNGIVPGIQNLMMFPSTVVSHFAIMNENLTITAYCTTTNSADLESIKNMKDFEVSLI